MATVVMEQIGRLFINAQQLRQIPQLLESAFPTLPCTVKAHDVPWVFREPHILGGYRQPEHSWRYYFLTLFQRHNEALNVWTHLLAAFIILVKCQELSETVDFLRDPHAQPLFIVLLSAFTYLSCSALAHLLNAKSELSHYTFYFLDYVGVAIYQYGSALAHFYYAIEEGWHTRVRGIFLPTAAFLAWFSCFGCCYGKYASPRLPKFAHKLFQVVPSGLAYCLDISPVLHRIYSCHQQEGGCSNQAVAYHRYQVIFFLVSAYFFACPHPERWLPGRCDFIGQGHQIFHVFLVLCTLVQIEATRIDYIERRPLYERLHGNLAHDAVALFIFTACCSALTAFYVRKRVQAQLCEKEK
ncbi:membrane progestin receptor alpha-like [Oncorhynchus nerka]|uniref:Progestin and adipoQ receptor family member VII, b n=1 Tax=Oncorhynchus kisutch TaxID=8019 RepID=A0A8C7F4K6_ONCKI|nr:membrane progestin receptor alpha [Oncorhynchus kisutch]XP_029537440.1 membrane progestin receptor alpha-like [Oncorhynchus nerka]